MSTNASSLENRSLKLERTTWVRTPGSRLTVQRSNVSWSLVALFGAVLCAGSLPARAAGKWLPLYNGRDLDGWVQRGGKAEYRADGKEIVGRAVPGTPNSFLCTTRVFTNFILELEFKPMTNLNSGVQVRSECFEAKKSIEAAGRKIDIPARRVHGYQIEIDPSARAWTGGLYDEGRRGWLQDLKYNEAARRAFKPEVWNRLRIECHGDSIKSSLNGVAATDYHDSLTPAGFIALQVHGVGTNSAPLEIRWRKVRLQELP